MSNDFLNAAKAIAPEIQSLRETFHRCPELGNREFETAKRIEAYLNSLGVATERLLDTAVVGTLRGALPGPTVALRADMDALPVEETTGAAFASERPGVMHACGHDVHLAAALGAAKLFSERRDALPGTVKFLFQPDEEGDGGARRMIAAGCLDNVDAVFGCHVSPDLPAGTVGIRYGKFYAASDIFDVTVLGKSAHGAERENGIDALGAAAELTTALLALPRELLPEKSVVTVGAFHAGNKENVLAARADLLGILRTLGQDSREKLQRRFAETLQDIAARTGTRVEHRFRSGHGGVVNTDPETALVERTATALLGAERVRRIETPTMTSEDFGFFIDALGAGCYYHIGAGCTEPLHAAAFLPDADAPVTAAAVHAAVLWAYLNGK